MELKSRSPWLDVTGRPGGWPCGRGRVLGMRRLPMPGGWQSAWVAEVLRRRPAPDCAGGRLQPAGLRQRGAPATVRAMRERVRTD